MGEDFLISAVLVVLLFIGALAVVCALFSLPDLEHERKSLQNCRDVVKSLEAEVDSTGGGRFELCCKKFELSDMNLNSENVQKIERILTPDSTQRHSSYTARRLYAVLCAVNLANLVRKAPSLNDLHELTSLQEQGNTTTAVFRTLTPSILVAGIGGTLLGVHQQLGCKAFLSGGISSLLAALGPGVIAVMLTIVCIVLRGCYNSRFSRFITELDTFTIKSLLPFFGSPNAVETSADELKKTMNRIRSVDYQALAESLGEYHQAVEAWRRCCAAVVSENDRNRLPQLAAAVMRFRHIRQRLGENHKRLVVAYETYMGLFVSYARVAAPLFARMELLVKILTRIAEQGGISEDDMQSLQTNIDTVSGSLSKLQKSLKNCELPIQAAHYAVSRQETQHVLSWLGEKLPAAVAQYELDSASNTELLSLLQVRGDEACRYRMFTEKRIQNIRAFLGEFVSEMKSVLSWSSGEFPGVFNPLNDIVEKQRYLPSKLQSLAFYPPGKSGLKMRVADIKLICYRFLRYNRIGQVISAVVVVGYLLWFVLL